MKTLTFRARCINNEMRAAFFSFLRDERCLLAREGDQLLLITEEADGTQNAALIGHISAIPEYAEI